LIVKSLVTGLFIASSLTLAGAASADDTAANLRLEAFGCEARRRTL
jgi:hypothetical protein